MSDAVRLGRVNEGTVVEFRDEDIYFILTDPNYATFKYEKPTQKTSIVLRHWVCEGIQRRRKFRVVDCLADDGNMLTIDQENFVNVLSRCDHVMGFTGTRSGMTSQQDLLVVLIIQALRPTLAVHGDCDGADTDFHRICLDHKDFLKIRIRPCNHRSRAWNEGADEVTEIKSPLARNLDIVKDSSILVATPPTEEELRRSGTWHTVRAARRAAVPRIIVWPSGRVTLEGTFDEKMKNDLSLAGVGFDHADK